VLLALSKRRYVLSDAELSAAVADFAAVDLMRSKCISAVT
jgi:hypothetical protein